ncbi:UDP-N-acetylglucosamine--LPS N-acetylglucosamine transferase [Ilumatobacter sp.]|uniref:UDP-N-acetylglucosamine--LPS N-acetylglucosamine transferase n=1 Tax=Ilumatobacter sp. TaxID=1967498 RepID=UPI003C417683
MTKRRVLLCKSNGAGLGHVTRMMAVAEQLGSEFDTTLFTLSAALPIPVNAGLRVEHLPSAGYLDTPGNAWHDLLEDRLEHLIARYRPHLIMFDGVHPYRGLTNVLGRRRRRRPVRVWMRRGMWKPGIRTTAIQLAEYFDHVVEPGDYAQSYDLGATAAAETGVHRVAPICYRGPNPPLDRAAACAHLGLDATQTNALIQLGAGAINDITSTLGQVVSKLNQRSVVVSVARSVLSAECHESTAGAAVVSEFPISRFFGAFDLAAIATGYNSFHEVLALGLPSIMVPNLDTATDDQDARSRWADEHGLGYRWDGTSAPGLARAVDGLVSSGERAEIRHRLDALPDATGSGEVAHLIDNWTST